MSKRRGGMLPRVLPSLKPSGLDIRMVMLDLPIVAPDPLVVSLGSSETADLPTGVPIIGAVAQRPSHRWPTLPPATHQPDLCALPPMPENDTRRRVLHPHRPSFEQAQVGSHGSVAPRCAIA